MITSDCAKQVCTVVYVVCHSVPRLSAPSHHHHHHHHLYHQHYHHHHRNHHHHHYLRFTGKAGIASLYELCEYLFVNITQN